MTRKRKGEAWVEYHNWPLPQSAICPACGNSMTRYPRRNAGFRGMTKDHIIPTSWGGWPSRLGNVSNIRLMCFNCNTTLPKYSHCIGTLACANMIQGHVNNIQYTLTPRKIAAATSPLQ